MTHRHTNYLVLGEKLYYYTRNKHEIITKHNLDIFKNGKENFDDDDYDGNNGGNNGVAHHLKPFETENQS